MGQALSLHIEVGGPPLYRQIADQIGARIDSGALPADHRLPPSRTLARELSIHRNTVVRAYEELDSRGYVQSVVGRGTFVCDRMHERGGEPRSDSDDAAGLAWSSLVAQAARAEPLARFDRLAQDVDHPDPINLSRMQPSEDLLPVAQLRRSLDRVLTKLGGAALTYAPRGGVQRLREIIAANLCDIGVPARAEDVIITTGSQQALDLLCRALVDPGDTFLVEAATYSGALNVAAAAGARLVGIASDAEGPRLDLLERAARHGAKGLYLMPNCHNPTGAMISGQRRRDLVEWSQRYGVPLIEDDFAAGLELDDSDGGQAPVPSALRTLSGDVVYVGTFSKKLIPALRVGYLVCPPALRPRLVSLKHAMDLGTSALLQHALADFLERGELTRHLAHTLPEYRHRCAALEDSLRRHLPPGFGWRHPQRGISLWLPLLRGLEPDRVFDAARRAGVWVSPSTLNAVSYGGGQAGLRLTFCAEPADRLAIGARRLAGVIEKLHGRLKERLDEHAATAGAVAGGDDRAPDESPSLAMV